MNLRGVKESVTALMPIFLVFLVTHVVLDRLGRSCSHAGPTLPEVAHAGRGAASARACGTLGALGMLLLFLRAYSLGGGTYTGIEAVSNGLQIMREPRVQTGKRTMVLHGDLAGVHRRRASCSATCSSRVAARAGARR